jgi:hypothetical protein
MKFIYTLILALALAGCDKGNDMQPTPSSEESPGVGLRKMILTTPPQEVGLAPDHEFPRIYGVLTDWRIGEQIASIVALKDGTASLYTTSTFGIIGGQGHENVRQVATNYVQCADKYFESSKPVTDIPYPVDGEVNFYLLTYDGLRLCVGKQNLIDKGTDQTRALFEQAQNLLTELRIITQE